MKKLLLNLSILFSLTCSSQAIDSVLTINGHSCKCPYRGKENKIFEKVQHPPSFPGGEKAWKEFVKDSLRVQFDGDKEEFQIQVVVDAEGFLSDLRSLNNISQVKIQEAKRLILAGGRWCPAMHNGRCVQAYHKIVFKL